MFLRFCQILGIYSDYVQSVFRVCFECVLSVFRVCSECVQSVFNIEVISSSSASSVSIFGIFFLLMSSPKETSWAKYVE